MPGSRRAERDRVTPSALVNAIDEVVASDPDKHLALYLHIPFCASKCHFCDWVAEVPVARLRSAEEGRRDYISALCAQISYYGPVLTRMGYQPQVMYWGGGTPTRLSVGEMQAIAAVLEMSFDLSPLAEWTVETTPNDLSLEKLEALRAIGVNRVSVGIQSFSAGQLRRSGRAHTGAQSVRAVELLRSAGIENFNLDLISGFPGEDLAALADTLATTIGLDPPHISVYPYRATPGTVMAMQLEQSVLAAHSAGAMIEAYEFAAAALQRSGYREYSYGYWVRQPEFEDRDGAYKYSLAGDRIGFGSGAESIIGHHLLWNENAKYAQYLASPREFTFSKKFSMSEPEVLTASVGGALMTREGLLFERFSRLTGLSFNELRETSHMRRWLEILGECGARFAETPAGLRIDAGTVAAAYINHLAFTTAAGLEIARA
jgi:coproporphyrinogen III oxidase-like Fe-S oxidoreductase